MVVGNYDLAEIERWLSRDYAILGRYGHQQRADMAKLTHRQRRSMIEAVLELLNEESESQRLSMERD